MRLRRLPSLSVTVCELGTRFCSSRMSAMRSIIGTNRSCLLDRRGNLRCQRRTAHLSTPVIRRNNHTPNAARAYGEFRKSTNHAHPFTTNSAVLIGLAILHANHNIGSRTAQRSIHGAPPQQDAAWSRQRLLEAIECPNIYILRARESTG